MNRNAVGAQEASDTPMGSILSRRSLLALGSIGSFCLSRRTWAVAPAIEEAGFVPIGGIEQWIAVEGQDATNPAILYLHGGPGEAQSPFLKQFLPWEHAFTVANWDQRGSGKTFGRNGPSTPEMTLDRLVDDAIEVTQHVCARLRKKKLTLVGQSWGSWLGVHVIKRRPELFNAFVGTGQVVSLSSSAAAEVRWARRQATAAADQATLKGLDDAAKLSGDAKLRTERMAARKYALSPSDLKYEQIVRAFIDTPAVPQPGDVADWIQGAQFSDSKLAGLLSSGTDYGDLRTLGRDMPIPFFVIQGRDDHIVSVDAALAYVQELRAPAKAFVAIAGGHWACFTNPRQFIGALEKSVRPLALS